MRVTTDIAVIGAGAAGLAAASALQARNIDCLVFEARDRAGGRAFTIATPEGFAIELGSEFIHGEGAVTHELMRRAGESSASVATDMFELRDGIVRESSDIWEATQTLLARANGTANPQSVRAFLESRRGKDDRRVIEQVAALVEGFDAAILEDADVRAIAQEWESPTNDFASRPANGYGPVIRQLASGCAERIVLAAPVHRIEQNAAGILLSGERFGKRFEVQARAVIVSVPVGVLQAGGIAFDPALSSDIRNALALLAMGPVVKVVLRFASAFWETVENGRYAGAAFFQTREAAMPTVWTQTPLASPTLTVWAGGGAAKRVSGGAQQHIAAAMETVSMLFPQCDTASQLRAAYTHDWQSDTWSRGAYTYVRVGGAGARETLAQPQTPIVFAGEAVSLKQSGTVAGAIESGYAAAAFIESV